MHYPVRFCSGLSPPAYNRPRSHTHMLDMHVRLPDDSPSRSGQSKLCLFESQDTRGIGAKYAQVSGIGYLAPRGTAPNECRNAPGYGNLPLQGKVLTDCATSENGNARICLRAPSTLLERHGAALSRHEWLCAPRAGRRKTAVGFSRLGPCPPVGSPGRVV